MIRRFLLLTSLALTCLFASPLSAAASNLYNGVDCRSTSATASSAICQTQTGSDPISGSNGLLAKITNIIAFVGGAAAVIVILVSALRYATSGSDLSTNSRTDTDVEAAKQTINNAVIGLAVILLARSIVLFALKKL